MTTKNGNFKSLIIPLIILLLSGACRLLTPLNSPPNQNTVIDLAPAEIPATPPPSIPLTPQPAEPSNTAEQIARLQPGQAVDIMYMDMIDENTGWGVGSVFQPEALVEHILRTTDGGHTWQDVSPPQASLLSPEEGITRMRVAGYFLDHNTAWVTYHEMDQTFNFKVWRTFDGGQTWELSELIKEDEVWDSLVHWQFIDANQGWAMLGGGAAAGASPVTLLHTTDGGQNWETFFSGSTGDGPLYSGQKTGMHFLDAQTGLITISDPSPKPSLLWTHDGGRTWERQVVSPPQNPPEFITDYGCTASKPQLFSTSFAALIISCNYADKNDVYRAKSAIYVTADGGSSWQILASPQEILDYFNTQLGFNLSQDLLDIPDVFQFEKVVSLVWSKPMNQFGEQIHFVTEQTGWMINFEPPHYSLSFTSDGGITWQPLEPTIIGPDD